MNQRKHSTFFFVTLAALMAFTSLSVDLYLPAMPQMAKELQGEVELTVTGFLLGFTFGQLVWGAISDRIGRKLPMIMGIALFVIGSVGCALSESLSQMVFWRVFQAFGASTAPMLARAMVRDSFDKSRAVQILSTLMMIMAVAPIVGPLLGGQMIKFGSWHNLFWLLAIFGSLMWLAVFALPETHRLENRSQGRLGQTFASYFVLLKNPEFMRYTLCLTFFYAGQYTFIIGSPQVYITYFGISSEDYGWFFALNIVGVMILSFANRTLSQRFSIDRLLKTATAFSATMGVLMCLALSFDVGGFWLLVVLILGYFSMVGIIASCATVGALEGIPQMAGAGSALLGALQYGSGILSSVLLALFANGTPIVMIALMAIFAVISLAFAMGKKFIFLTAV